MLSGKTVDPDERPVNAWAIAGLVVLAVLAVWLVLTRRHPEPPPHTVLPVAAYAGNLPLSDFAMSESTSLSGGKLTFLDGKIRNAGGATISGVTVQAIFRNDEGLAPQVETLPMALIRVREPYIDTQPVSAAPLKPGDEREFRLIFERLPGSWNQQLPEVRVVTVR
jgi:hypothetical protein